MEAIDRARSAIDAANAADPNEHEGEPLALVQGRLAEGWVVLLDPHASSALRLAARAHHLRRWVVPRASYPGGRAGYLRWRRDQKHRHAHELGELLAQAGVETAVAERASSIVAKVGLGSDPEVQVFEDAVCLTFLETQLSDTADRLDAEHMTNVIAKTLAKMSEAGKAAALTIELDGRGRDLLARAVDRHQQSK
ncbi:MAG TPA: DUF4202 domain-containing protein [Ilumatobacter sp.]|jgi:hypothetical protein|nr:DUF4202 domain-containing protein [Ilumatobacter sp.]